jgi:lipopolysaccharide export system ATP-binding protein
VEQNLRAVLERTVPSRLEQMRRVKGLLEEFGLWELRRQKAWTLSGGEKRRLEVARAMISEPKIIMLDEPFVGIDPITVGDLKTMISALKERGIGILITDHNVRETLPIIERAYLMFDGKILVEGNSRQLLEDPKARELYLGHDFKI